MDAVHSKGYAELHVTGPQKIPVQGVDEPRVGECARGGDDGLRENLAAEDAPVWHPLAGPGEDVVAGASARVGEIQSLQHRGDRVHGS